jgi:hypothetical protein
MSFAYRHHDVTPTGSASFLARKAGRRVFLLPYFTAEKH